jgi:magnesium-transporting ATPase (P-type)
MTVQGRWLVGAVLVAAVALWLLLAGPARILGFDGGQAGIVLLMATAWMSLFRISRAPRDQLEGMASPSEWRAWLGLGFMLAAVVYFLVKAQVFQRMSAWNDPDAAAVARNLVMLLIAWAVLANVLASRWKGAVQEDERDREIEQQAAGWGRGALVFIIIGIAVMLGFSPAERLQWARPFVIANLLVFALMWGWLCEYAATAIYYWRDRRA